MKEFIKDVLIALVIVVVITLIIKPTIVKESSMESTLYEIIICLSINWHI